MGIESIIDRNLNYMGKKTNKEKMIKTIGLAQKAGLQLRGNFIIGFPGESHEEIKTNINFAASLKLHRTAFFMLTPYPHSMIWNEAVERNIIDVDAINKLPSSVIKEQASAGIWPGTITFVIFKQGNI